MATSGKWFSGTWTPGHDISPSQTEFATARRVPFLTSPYPSRRYVSGIVVCDFPWQGIVPTEEEVEIVAGVITGYLDYLFPKPSRFRQEMEEFAPYDLDREGDGFYFIKRPDGSWAYRRHSWTGAGSYTFRPSTAETPHTLEQVIERSNLRWDGSVVD